MDEHVKAIEDVCDRMKNMPEGEEKDRLRREFWLLAVDAFNTHIAGDVTTITGQVVHTPEIEF